MLRTSLRPGLLKAVAYNESHRMTGVSLYEIGHAYPPGDGQLPDEFEALCVVLAGREVDAAVQMWREIAAALGVGARLDQGIVPAGLHPGRSAALTIGRDQLGAIGEVHPDVALAFGVHERTAVLELDLTLLLAREPSPAQAKPVSRYPSSDIDLAFVLADSVPAERLEKAIRQGAGNLLADLALFDVYRGRRRRRGCAQPRLPPAAAGPGPHPHRHRGRRRARQVHHDRRRAGGVATRLSGYRGP